MERSGAMRNLVCAILLVTLNSAWALTPEAELDRCLMAAEKYINAQDYSHAEIYLEKIEQLKIETPADFDFFVGVVSENQHKDQVAQQAFDRYVQKAGKSGKYYKTALEHITELEERIASQATPPMAAIANKADGLSVNVENRKASGLNSTDSVGMENPDASYDEKIKQKYRSDDTVKALIEHINTLLSNHVFVASKIKNSQTQDSELFSVSVAQKNELVVTRQSKKHRNGQLQSTIAIDRLDVFGVNPYIEYSCDRTADSCWMRHPSTGNQWMILENNESAANEVSKALTRLMKALQRPTG